MKAIDDIISAIQVVDIPDMTKIRLGNEGDGGYVVLKEVLEKTTALYSYGIGDDISFETDYVRRIPYSLVHMFDPFIDAVPMQHPRFRFNKTGLGCNWGGLDKADSELPMLKIDVEWNEWSGLLMTEENTIQQFGMLVCEFHLLSIADREDLSPYFKGLYSTAFTSFNDLLFSTYAIVLKKLSEIFYLFHIHPNNSLPKMRVGEYDLPPLLELSFVRKDLVGEVIPSKESFPIEGLDFPNKTDRPDIQDFYPMGL